MNGHQRQFGQAVVVAVCLVVAGAAPFLDSITTELFLTSLGGGAVCSAWIFSKSEAKQQQ
jgi:hypothetical protein